MNETGNKPVFFVNKGVRRDGIRINKYEGIA